MHLSAESATQKEVSKKTVGREAMRKLNDTTESSEKAFLISLPPTQLRKRGNHALVDGSEEFQKRQCHQLRWYLDIWFGEA